MEREKINGIVKEKNERLERDALRSAEEIIDTIAKEQGNIQKAEKRIIELRNELKELTVSQLDANQLLGD